MATQTTLNTTGTTFLNKTHYDREMLAIARTQLLHAKYGQKRNIPKKSGKTIEWRRWNLFDPALAINGLTDGVTPASQDLGQTKVEATVKQYGAYVEISDFLDLTAYDDVTDDSVELIGEQLGTVIEWVTRDAMNAGSNVQYANGKTSRATIAVADKLTVLEVRKAVRTLQKLKARKFTMTEDGKKRGKHYICICSPDSTFDLQDDPLWKDVSTYSNAEQIYEGEIGKMFGVVFVTSTEAKVFEDAGATGADVHSTLVFGRDSYGVVDINGSGAIRTIIKKPGSAGTADPLDQRGSVGGKVMAYATKILNDNWIVRIEHGVTA